MKYRNRLTFAYYSITFWDFKSLQSVPKSWQVLKTKQIFFLKMSKYRNTVFYDYQSWFLDIFSSNYRHRLVLKVPFPNHSFPKISKHRTENRYFPSTGKYYVPLSPLIKLQTEKFIKIHQKVPMLKSYLKSKLQAQTTRKIHIKADYVRISFSIE